MLQLEVLILKLVAVDGFASCAISTSEVATLEEKPVDYCEADMREGIRGGYLAHKLCDHTMEGGPLVAKALLTSTECTKVF